MTSCSYSPPFEAPPPDDLSAPPSDGFGIDGLTILVDAVKPFPGRRTIRVGGAPVHVSPSRLGLDHRVRIDFNPSRLDDPDGFLLSPPETLPERVRWVVDSLPHSIEITEGFLHVAKVTRLDVSRDFEVGAPADWLAALGRTRITHARQRSLGLTREGRLSSYRAGGKTTGHVLVYSKAGDHTGAPAGHLRFEVQARARWLSRAAIAHLDEITPTAVHHLARDRFAWILCGRPLAPLPEPRPDGPLVTRFLNWDEGSEDDVASIPKPGGGGCHGQ